MMARITTAARETTTGVRRPGPAVQRSGDCSDKGGQAGYGAADDQGVDLAGALVGVDRLGVRDEPADLLLQQDAVPAEQFAGVADALPHPHRAERLGQRRMLVGG